MNQLLLDIGNTRIKWASRGQQGLGAITAIAHADPGWPAEFASTLTSVNEPDAICIAAVAPDLITASGLRVLAARWPKAAIRRVQSSARLGRFVSSYAQPERLGVDRFLACAAAAEHAQALLLLGCGTAFTADLIAADGTHIGGMIGPSPETMRAAVLSRTARVHWLREGSLRDFGRNTEDALETGVWNAAVGMVERAIGSAAKLLGSAPALLAHGGSAAALAALLSVPVRIDPLLLMRGLAMWADQPEPEPEL
jgi:type III pantothenate kinase